MQQRRQYRYRCLHPALLLRVYVGVVSAMQRLGCATVSSRGEIGRQPESRRVWSALSVVSLLVLLFACTVRDANSAATEPSQSDVEAVYLFDFGKFVRWPDSSASGPMQICVAGIQAFADGMQRLVSNEHIEGRGLAVRHVEGPLDTTGCSILFIDSSERDRAAALLTAVAGKPTLTVSDLPDFLDRGGMIQFLLIGKRVRFDVNLRPVTQSKLSLSSELLKVAVNVKGQPEGGAQ